MSDSLKLLSVNVRGLTDRVKRNKIFQWCQMMGDIIFLQETFSTEDTEGMWKADWKGKMFFSHGSNHSRGVIIMFKSMVDFLTEKIIIDKEGRYVLMKGKCKGENIILGSVYFPTRNKETLQCNFLSDLDKILSSVVSQEYSLIVGGDFNIAINRNLDYMGANYITKHRYRDLLVDFLDRLNLIDVWRKRHPNKKEFTFKQNNPFVQSRLDYIFISSKLEKDVKSSDILPSITPDHAGVRVELNNLVDTFTYGRSYWKFNSSLCDDKDFVEGIKMKISEIERIWRGQIRSKIKFWEFMKMKLREYIMAFSRGRAKLRRSRIEKLEKEIKVLEDCLTTNFNVDIQNEIELKKEELDKLFDYSRQGLKVRSRVEWSEEGEKNSQFFEQLLKSNKRRSAIKEIYNEHQEMVKDCKGIIKIIRDFYKNLYACKNLETSDDVKNMFLNDLPKLSNENRDFCECPITQDECFQALKEMKWNKSPGNDGFTAEFYFTFWPLLKEIVVEAFNESLEVKLLSNSQRQGVITLIEKEGKNPLHMKNYRPITLLNVDYKILSKVLATRVKEVLGDIVHCDQVGYVKDRNIGEAVRLIDDMFFQSLHKPLGFLIAVDFEKAFDSISHKFLFKTLEYFGFGENLCSWIKTLYRNVSSCVLNGGHSTGYFEVTRGVRQGDPLSPYLFVIAIELLAHYIRIDENIKGIGFGKREIKQVLYADDITLFLKDMDSIHRVEKIFKDFESLSGLKINMDKTNFLLLGEERDSPGLPVFGHLVQHIKILGVYFARDFKVKDDLNYKEILSKIKRRIGWWKQRDLTMYGRIKLLKMFAFSRLNYVSSLMTVPKDIFKEIEQISFNFIWRGRDRIKRKVLYQDYSVGGLRVPNFEIFVKTQRIMWIKRLLDGGTISGWKSTFEYFFSSLGGRFIFLCNYDTSKMNLKCVPLFYIDMLKAWQELDECRHFGGKINPIIFNNKCICLKNKTFFDTELFQKGILKASDIIVRGHLRPISYWYDLKFSSENLLRIHKICSVIREEWIQGDFMEVDTTNFEIELIICGRVQKLCDIKSRKVYDHFIDIFQNDYVFHITDVESEYNLGMGELKKVFLRLKCAMLCNKHREFQYKQLQGAVYTKRELFKFGFETDHFCSFCKKEVESYQHLFFECPEVKRLWGEMSKILQLNELGSDSWKTIFMGMSGNTTRASLINCIIFLVKYIIFGSRKQGTLPTVQKLTRMVKEYRDTEYQIAFKKGKLGVHLRKWEQINVLLL